MDTWDNSTKVTVQKIPLLTINAGPRDGDKWKSRLKEEFTVRLQTSSRGPVADFISTGRFSCR